MRGYHTYRDIWATVVGEELLCQSEVGNRVDNFAVAGRNRYKCVIAAGLTEEDKDSLGAGRTSTVLNSKRSISGTSKQTDPRVEISQFLFS